MLSKRKKICTMDEEDCENAVQQGWGSLNNNDILVHIFENYFRHDELTSGVAHVCRGWRMACCDPILWSFVDLTQLSSTFNEIQYDKDREKEGKLTRFLKVSMSLSKKSIQTLLLPFALHLRDDMLRYTTERCPNLRRLIVPSWRDQFIILQKFEDLKYGIDETGLCNAVPFCKKLESLTMPCLRSPHNVFLAIKESCEMFRDLKVMGRIHLLFAQKLVQHLPNLKVLSLRCTAIHKDALIKILDEMQHLEVLNISHSYFLVEQKDKRRLQRTVIVREADEAIMEKASKLKQFLTCTEHKTCLLCQRTEKVQGLSLWCKYNEDELWKEDEVSSLRL